MSFMSALMPGGGSPPTPVPGSTPRMPMASKARQTPMYWDKGGMGLGSSFDVLGLGNYDVMPTLKPIANGVLSSLKADSIAPSPRTGYHY